VNSLNVRQELVLSNSRWFVNILIGIRLLIKLCCICLENQR
jgi:hypothetical protein